MVSSVIGSFIGSRNCIAPISGTSGLRNVNAVTLSPNHEPVRAPKTTEHSMPIVIMMKNLRIVG